MCSAQGMFSQHSVCRGQWTQSPSEPREDSGPRRPHRQAVLQGCRRAQRHHHLEEGRGQPPTTGEEMDPPRRPTGSVESPNHTPPPRPTPPPPLWLPSSPRRWPPASASSGSPWHPPGCLAFVLLHAPLGPNIGPAPASPFYALSVPLVSRCPAASGAADPSHPWQARSERTDIATLLIPAITTADAGFYLCVATSPAGTAQARIQVVVLSGVGPLGTEGWGGQARAPLGPADPYSVPSLRCQPTTSQD